MRERDEYDDEPLTDDDFPPVGGTDDEDDEPLNLRALGLSYLPASECGGWEKP